MAIRYYDEAIYNKIQSWIKNPNMRVLKPDETSRLLRTLSDQTSDSNISLPIITLSRDTSIQLDSNIKRSMSFNGYPIKSTNKITYALDAIPITVNYQLDIFTKSYDEGDEYIRNFVFQLVNHPKLKIQIPYNNISLEHIAYIRLLPTITDNSDIPEKLFPDQFTRWTLQLELQDAYLFSIPTNINWAIDNASLILKDYDESEEIEEPIDISTNNSI